MQHRKSVKYKMNSKLYPCVWFSLFSKMSLKSSLTNIFSQKTYA